MGPRVPQVLLSSALSGEGYRLEATPGLYEQSATQSFNDSTGQLGEYQTCELNSGSLLVHRKRRSFSELHLVLRCCE